jgi:hypothetical protein
MTFRHNFDPGLFKCFKDLGDGTGYFYRVSEEEFQMVMPDTGNLVCYHWSTMRVVSL